VWQVLCWASSVLCMQNRACSSAARCSGACKTCLTVAKPAWRMQALPGARQAGRQRRGELPVPGGVHPALPRPGRVCRARGGSGLCGRRVREPQRRRVRNTQRLQAVGSRPAAAWLHERTLSQPCRGFQIATRGVLVPGLSVCNHLRVVVATGQPAHRFYSLLAARLPDTVHSSAHRPLPIGARQPAETAGQLPAPLRGPATTRPAQP